MPRYAGARAHGAGRLAADLRAGLRVQKNRRDVIGNYRRRDTPTDTLRRCAWNGAIARTVRTLDDINRQMGRGTVRLLGEGISPPWSMRRSTVSPHYTTRLSDVAIAQAR